MKKSQSDKNFDLAFQKQQAINEKNAILSSNTNIPLKPFPFAEDSGSNQKSKKLEKNINSRKFLWFLKEKPLEQLCVNF